MNDSVSPVASKRLYQQVADKMLMMIESGEYPVGSRLPAERELAEQFGVSRPTIREAIIALETRGRLAVRTGSGVSVLEQKVESRGFGKTVSPFELIESRVFIEGEAAALAATFISKEQLAELADALEEMAQENSLDFPPPNTADRKFHSIIANATNNRVFSEIVVQLWDLQESLDNIRMAHLAVCMKDTRRRLSEHKAIYDALARGDANGARMAMRNHFTRSLTALHETTEQAAVSEVHKKVSEMRERFSIERMVDSSPLNSEG